MSHSRDPNLDPLAPQNVTVDTQRVTPDVDPGEGVHPLSSARYTRPVIATAEFAARWGERFARLGIPVTVGTPPDGASCATVADEAHTATVTPNLQPCPPRLAHLFRPEPGAPMPLTILDTRPPVPMAHYFVLDERARPVLCAREVWERTPENQRGITRGMDADAERSMTRQAKGRVTRLAPEDVRVQGGSSDIVEGVLRVVETEARGDELHALVAVLEGDLMSRIRERFDRKVSLLREAGLAYLTAEGGQTVVMSDRMLDELTHAPRPVPMPFADFGAIELRLLKARMPAPRPATVEFLTRPVRPESFGVPMATYPDGRHRAMAKAELFARAYGGMAGAIERTRAVFDAVTTPAARRELAAGQLRMVVADPWSTPILAMVFSRHARGTRL